jgi:hypothetical protein
MDITRTRARLTDITGLAISTAAYLLVPVRGSVGVAADTGVDADIGADVDTTVAVVMATADVAQLAVVSEVER